MADKNPQYIPAVVDGIVEFCAHRKPFNGVEQEGFNIDLKLVNDQGRPVIVRAFSDKEMKLGPVKGLHVQLGVITCRI